MLRSLLLLLLLFFCSVVEIRCHSTKETLVLVHTIFRHGDRTPEAKNLYKSNPYYNESNYAPFGYGQLTNAGKLRAYNIGTVLRKRYNGFLDEAYSIDLIEPRSTDFNRTKTTLQAMLAGLFPPTRDLIWLEGFIWQPIPFNYVERQYDKELYFYGCPNWDKTMDAYLRSVQGQDFTNKYSDIFKYISENTGENITDILQVYYLYFGFLIQEELNFTLPKWTKAVYPYPMRNITIDYYALMFATTSLRKMAAGYLFKKIINDTKNKINGNTPKTKMYIYSGHENNIASALKIFNVGNEGDIAPYGSYVLIEVHYIDGTYIVKMFYQDYSSSEPVLLSLPECGDICTFETFVSIANKFLPEDDSVCGNTEPVTTRNSNDLMESRRSMLALTFFIAFLLGK